MKGNPLIDMGRAFFARLKKEATFLPRQKCPTEDPEFKPVDEGCKWDPVRRKVLQVIGRITRPSRKNETVFREVSTGKIWSLENGGPRFMILTARLQPINGMEVIAYAQKERPTNRWDRLLLGKRASEQ